MDTITQLNAALESRYVIEREIGRGGMATVFLARDLRHDRLVALKVLNPELGAVLGVERFLSEIKVTANLQHPHLLPLFDSGEADGLLFYVMPYVDGESLRARLEREKQLPTDEAIAIAAAVGSALEYAHEHGVIHRDLKPENILLQDGQAVVADFGIALAVSIAGGARVTQTGLSLGTPQYMSPEQATGDRVIDRRSDIYSLAAVTYEMLTGEPPHTGSTMQAIIARVLTERPRSVRSVRPNLPEHVEFALDRALEKLPADRWSSAREFIDALQGKGAAGAARGAASRFAAPAARDGWRARLTDPVLLGVAALAAAGVIGGEWAWRASHHAEPPAIVRFTLGLAPGMRAGSSNNQTSKLAISPDGRTVAFIGVGEGGRTRVFLRALDDVHVHVVAGTEGASSPFFSPDGQWLGFQTAGRVLKVPIGGGTPLLIAPTPAGVFGVAWTRQHVIVMSNNSRLVVVPETGGQPRLLTALDSIGPLSFELQPMALGDGSNIIYVLSSSLSAATGQLVVASLATGKIRRLGLAAIAPLAVVDKMLIFANLSGIIMAVGFDVDRAEIRGTPEAIQNDVAVNILTGATQAAVSPNGTLVYQSGSGVSQLVTVDARGAGAPVLPEARSYGYPRYSPDGKKIAIGIDASNRSDIWVIDVASSTATRLTTEGNVNERPEWTPDSKRVLYRTDVEGRSSMWWRPADLSEPAKPLLTRTGSNFFEGVITPDGRDVIYQLDTAGADIYYRAIAGDTAPKPIATASKFVEDMARISPDGRWVVFVTDESGVPQVVVQPFPGPGARTQVSLASGVEPVWSRDGRRIFYRDNQQFVAANVRTSPEFAVTSRDVLFDDHFLGSTLPHANYDVAPDGSHFLFLRAAEQAELQVVVNWRAVLRERLVGEKAKAP